MMAFPLSYRAEQQIPQFFAQLRTQTEKTAENNASWTKDSSIFGSAHIIMGADRKWIIVRIDGKTVDIKKRPKPLYSRATTFVWKV